MAKKGIDLSGNVRLTCDRMRDDGWIDAVEEYVAYNSQTGDPDHSLRDWLAAGNYRNSPSLASIVEDWDSDR